jgi:indole-3-glycerol phosphate synthase
MQASLESIVAAARRRVSEKRSAAELRELDRRAAEHTPRGFREQLRQRSQNGAAVIAELKKASPSKGLIRADFQPAALASSLEAAGASALSVLTDEEFFQGSLTYLRQASEATHLPCLRKDFIVDRSQILEARAHRADAVLLIVAALEQAELRALADEARRHELDILCEAHTEQELRCSLDAGCDLIGINSRDLRTFHVDLATAFRLVEKIPAGCVRVAESGIQSGADIAGLRAAGYDAFLIGESLMRAENPAEALKKLLCESGQTGSTMNQADVSPELEARSSKLFS